MNRLQLDRGEQIGVVLCSVAVIALIFLGMYVFAGPRKEYMKSRADLLAAVDNLGAMQNTKQSVEDDARRMSTLLDALKKREAGFSLFGFVDKTIGDLDMRAFANTTNALRGRDSKDSKLDMVQLSLRGVGLKQIVDVLHALYSSHNLIVVQRLDRLSPSQSGNGLDCELVLATLKV
jgi:hypothetical protein